MDRREKALHVIEWLANECGDPADDILEAIYKYTHVALGRCSNPHPDWVAELDKAYQELVDAGQLPREGAEVVTDPICGPDGGSNETDLQTLANASYTASPEAQEKMKQNCDGCRRSQDSKVPFRGPSRKTSATN